MEGIFKAKGRPSDNPLIVHVSSIEMLQDLISPNTIPTVYLKIISEFWPGPLTILLPKPDSIPNQVTAGQETVAIRIPNHAIARKLIDLCGFPLAAPSANTSGRPSPTNAQHVFDDLSGRIPMILDGGSCDSGVESTVLDGLRDPPCILRPGGVTYEMLVHYLPGLQVYKRDFTDVNLEETPSTPGMKYRHYSPNVPVILVELSTLDPKAQLVLLKREYEDRKDNSKIGVLLALDEPLQTDYPYQLSLGATPKQVAHSLFQRLREMENQGVDLILVQGIMEDDEGLAVMNRLRKAASKII